MVTLLLGLAFLKTLNETTIFMNETTRNHQPGQKETENPTSTNRHFSGFYVTTLGSNSL